MAFKMNKPSIIKGTAAHKSALKHIVDDNKEHQEQFGDMGSAHDRDNPQTPQEHKGYKHEDLITREDTGPEAGADYNEPDSAMKKRSPAKRAAWKGKKAHLKSNIDESDTALTVKQQLASAKLAKKYDLEMARRMNIKKDAWSEGKGARGRNTQLETGYRSVLGKEPSMRPKTKDVKREIRQKYRDIKKEARTVKKHKKILREDSLRGEKLRAHTLRTKRSKALQEGRKLSAKDYNIRDLEKEVGYEKGRNKRGRKKVPKKVAERYGVDPQKSWLQYRG